MTSVSTEGKPQPDQWWLPFSGSYNPVDDLIRTLFIGAGIFLLLVIFRVTYLRFRNGAGRHEGSGWAMLSYGMFVFVAVYDGLHRYGVPIDWVRVGLWAVALTTGVTAVVTTLRFRPFGHEKQTPETAQRLADEAEGRSARLSREMHHRNGQGST